MAALQGQVALARSVVLSRSMHEEPDRDRINQRLERKLIGTGRGFLEWSTFASESVCMYIRVYAIAPARIGRVRTSVVQISIRGEG